MCSHVESHSHGFQELKGASAPCGKQQRLQELKNFEMGETIHVSIEIHVVCSNPNPYQVRTGPLGKSGQNT